eukprot:gene9154-18965_t
MASQEIFEYAKTGKRKELRKLLEKYPECLNAIDSRGCTPILSACAHGHMKVAIMLAEMDANINVQDKNMRTALHYSCAFGRQDVASLLAQKGASLNIKEKNGWTPFHLACDTGSVPVASLLAEQGADINARDNHGYTALHYACAYTRTEVAMMLIELNADVDVKENEGRTAFELATDPALLSACTDLLRRREQAINNVAMLIEQVKQPGWISRNNSANKLVPHDAEHGQEPDNKTSTTTPSRQPSSEREREIPLSRRSSSSSSNANDPVLCTPERERNTTATTSTNKSIHYNESRSCDSGTRSHSPPYMPSPVETQSQDSRKHMPLLRLDSGILDMCSPSPSMDSESDCAANQSSSSLLKSPSPRDGGGGSVYTETRSTPPPTSSSKRGKSSSTPTVAGIPSPQTVPNNNSTHIIPLHPLADKPKPSPLYSQSSPGKTAAAAATPPLPPPVTLTRQSSGSGINDGILTPGMSSPVPVPLQHTHSHAHITSQQDILVISRFEVEQITHKFSVELDYGMGTTTSGNGNGNGSVTGTTAGGGTPNSSFEYIRQNSGLSSSCVNLVMYRGLFRDKPVAVRRCVKSMCVSQDGGSVSAQLSSLQQRLLRELHVLAACKHENLLPLIAVCVDPSALCMVYPLGDVGSLQDVMSSRTSRVPFGASTRIRILQGICSALAYLHTADESRGKPWVIVHRNVKPAKVLLTGPDGSHARLAGLDLSSLIVDETDNGSVFSFETTEGSFSTLEGLGIITGSSGGYLDPLYTETGEINVLSDVYSFGVVMLQVVTGAATATDSSLRPPGLVARSRNQIRNGMRIAEEGVFTESVEHELVNLIFRCISLSVFDRPADCAVLLRSLSNLASESILFSG